MSVSLARVRITALKLINSDNETLRPGLFECNCSCHHSKAAVLSDVSCSCIIFMSCTRRLMIAQQPWARVSTQHQTYVSEGSGGSITGRTWHKSRKMRMKMWAVARKKIVGERDWRQQSKFNVKTWLYASINIFKCHSHAWVVMRRVYANVESKDGGHDDGGGTAAAWFQTEMRWQCGSRVAVVSEVMVMIMVSNTHIMRCAKQA